MSSIKADKAPRWKRVIGLVLRRSHVDDEFWEELEEGLIMADTGVQVAAKLIAKTQQMARKQHATSGDTVKEILKQQIITALDKQVPGSLLAHNHPLAIMLIGVNGSGKTTTAAKLAHLYQQQGRSVTLAAADTFRAGAIEQLQQWGSRLGVRVIAQSSGSDPAAVVYDALSSIDKTPVETLLIDTAGRLQTRHNLMEEVRKLRRIFDSRGQDFERAALLVIDGATGCNSLSQAKAFKEAVQCNGIIITKMDGTAKAGFLMSVVSETNLPVLWFGNGERLDDLHPFEASAFADNMLNWDNM